AAIEWSAHAPASGRDVKEMSIPKTSAEMLGYDSGKAVKWSDDRDRQWQMFYFRWLPTRREMAVQQALGHRPEICLPASGFTLQSELEIERWEAAGLGLPFRVYVFSQDNQPVH